MPRTLVVSDGFTSASAPSGGLAGFTAVGVYASTAAYVSAKGSAAANGDCFINSSDDLFYYYVGSAWQTVVLPASAQSLTNKDFDGGTASNTSRITIPKGDLSTLQGLTRKEGTILYATDQVNFYLDDGTNLRPLGSGSGGSGINWIENNDFNIDVSGVTAYADPAAEEPDNGVDGSPTFAASRTITDPLRGDGSLLLTKDDSNRQGEGVALAFTVARGYRNKRHKISFAYEVKSGTFAAGSSSDLRVFVYDVTNSQLITPSQVTIDSQDGVFIATFDASDSTSYRLLLHVATTSASAWTIAIDDIEVGPNQVILGPAMSDWQEFTPTGSWNTNVVYTGFWRRVGDSMEVYAKVECDGGAPNSATLTINMPSGYEIDVNKLTGALAQREVLGRSYTTNVGTGAYYGNVVGDTSTSVLPQWTDSAAAAASAFKSVTQASPFTYGDTDYVQVYFKVPVVGWKTNLITANNRTFRLAESYSMTRVTATPTKLGEYRSYLRQSSAATFTETNGAPTATPSVADGFRIYQGNAWGTADTNNEPTRYEVFVGKNKSVQVQWYSSAGRTGFVDVSPYSFSTSDVGYVQSYDPSTGILSLTSQLVLGSSRSAHISGVNQNGNGTVSDPYFDVFVSDAPSIPLTNESQQATESVVNTASGHGSTGANIVTFSNEESTTGHVVYTSDSTDGDSWEILKAGVYSISAAVNYSAGNRDFGISLNSSATTTNINAIAQSERLIMSRSSDQPNSTGQVAVTRRLAVGDVIKVHDDGGTIGSAAAQSKFSIVRVGE